MAGINDEFFIKDNVDLNQTKEYLNTIREQLIFLENEYVWKTEESSIETIDVCRKILIINTILNNPERLPLDDIFEELMQNELNGRYKN